MNRDEVLRTLNELYAEEVEAALRYLHLTVTLANDGETANRDELLEGVTETLEHAQVIAAKIRELGALPRLRVRVDLVGETHSSREAFLQAREFEGAARDAYRDLAEQAAGDGALVAFAEAQVELETKHLERFEELLGERDGAGR